MADDDPIQIVVTDGVAKTIQPGLEGIATAAVSASNATDQLKAQLGQATGFIAQASISAKDFASALLMTGNNLAAITPEVIAVANGTLAATDSLRGYTAAQISLLKAQQDGANFQAALNEQFGITTAAGAPLAASARESAAAFNQLLGETEALAAAQAEAVTLTRGLTEAQIAQFKAAQDGVIFMEDLNASFGLNASVTKSAADSAAVFTAAMDAELAAAAEAAAGIEALSGATVANAESTRAASGAWSGLIGTLVAFFAIKEVVGAVDSYTRLTNALKQSGLAGQALEDEFAKITAIANANGASVDSLAAIYQKLAIVQQNTGLNQANLTKVTNEIAQSFRIQGITAQQAYNSMRDLGDIADLTTVKWANFYRLQQADPALVRAAAAGLGVTLQELDQQVQAHTLTTQKFFQGILKGADAMQALTDKTHLTITGALNDLNTSFVNMVDNANKGTGALYLIAQGIQALAENLPLVTTLVLAFGTAWALVKLVELTQSIYNLVQGLVVFTATMAPATIEIIAAATPMLILAGAVVLMGAAILSVTGQMDNFTKMLGDVANQAIGALGINKIGPAIRSLTGELTDSLVSTASYATGMNEATAATVKTTGATHNLTSALAAANQNGTQFKSTLVNVATAADGSTVYINRLSAGVYQLKYSIEEASTAAQDFSKIYANAFSPAGQNSDISYLPKATSFPDITTLSAPKFASGGSTMVMGGGGTDTTHVSLWATPGERIDVLTPEQQRAQASNQNGKGDTHIHLHGLTIVTPDINSFNNSKAQVARQIGSMISAGAKNG